MLFIAAILIALLVLLALDPKSVLRTPVGKLFR
ncbi:hypothetical protein SEA_SKOG_12 [Gordonia phage Skog]|uniref:Uncharacterized protein n=1 Tax=Gordonia phage Skog TaxID=2704033 RepID=A0A6G6XJH0_9CAUD|nr:hypothetical protein KHQ85_gp012 [Gordonia phage Skog]QIG58164.1 hypothetical protein SEA_SKOG_12 [Gordonia phage Skog]